jgi:predicted permease
MTGGGSGTAHVIEDKPTSPGELPPVLWFKYAAPGYFEAMGTRLLEGRTLERLDHQGQLPNVVVNKATADRVWPGESALGKRVSFASGDSVMPWYTVVGVVETVRDTGLDQDARELVYYPMVGLNGDEDWTTENLMYAVRTAGPPTALAGAVRAQVWEMDAGLPIADMQPLSDIVAESTARTSFTMMALGVAAVVALLLGAIGVYGVLSYVVSERTREIGVRIALGAESGEVLGMVVKQGLKLAGMGLVVGLIASFGLTRLMDSLLYGTSPTDPLTFGTTSLVLLAVGAAASYLPARRASSIDPVESLRSE